MRYGELTAFEERPHSPYFGSADATPLYVVLLDEYERWTGDRRLVRDLEQEARAALNWIDEYADLMGNGYVWYRRRNEETGLENQCWKDSWDSISYRDGRLPGFPRATCELQGYAYDAKVRGARLARSIWKDSAFADELEREAADLKRRFNRDFWVSDGEYFALALDTEGNQVDSLTSNNGHLLWSGIVDKSKAKAVARHLLGPRLFSGWGVRTLAEGEGRYNPIGYHVGTVWPFDSSFVAWGLRNYGFKEEAAQIAAGILDAAEFFEGRLPEAFGGYERGVTKYPVQYPTACSPQAWSTGAPLLLLRTMLGLEPIGDNLVVDPVLPESIGLLALLDIPGRWGRVDAFARGASRPLRCVLVGGPGRRLGAEPRDARGTRGAGGREGDRASRTALDPGTTRSHPLDRGSRAPVAGRAPRRLVGLRGGEVEHRVARGARRGLDWADKGEPGQPSSVVAAQLRLLDLRGLVRGVYGGQRAGDGARRATLPPRVPDCVRRLARDEPRVESAGAPGTYMPQYRQPELARAVRLDREADKAHAAGVVAGKRSDDYVRTTVFLATVLFLVGISTQFPLRGVRYGLVAVGAVLLVFSVVQLAQLPGLRVRGQRDDLVHRSRPSGRWVIRSTVRSPAASKTSSISA